MIYILLFVVGGGGGFSAEFNTLGACEAARDAFVAEAKGPHVAMCVPKG
mgnify:CR=1 FL=1